MSIGILGTKIGMTQIFSQKGEAIPVTIIKAGPCMVTQVKTEEKHNYNAVQIGYGRVNPKLLTEPMIGHLKKAGAPPLKYLREYRVSNSNRYSVGQWLTVSLFKEYTSVDVSGRTIGKGFAGYQKRHHFSRGPMTHGSKNKRSPGSIGPGTNPGRIYPGKRMAGHAGDETVTIMNLSLLEVNEENNLLLVKGSVPGKIGNLLSISAEK